MKEMYEMIFIKETILRYVTIKNDMYFLVN